MSLFYSRISRVLLPLILLSFFASKDLYSYGDQTTSERILQENRMFISFLNLASSNFRDVNNEDFAAIYEKYHEDLNQKRLESGEEEDNTYLEDTDYQSDDPKKALFKNLYELHFNADVAYLQSDYNRTYHRVYSSQDLIARFYQGILYHVYLEDSKDILDSLAPMIIRSKNSRARHYLTLGYRDRTVSWNHYTIGEASNPKLFSYKIYQFREGINMARRAKKYAFLALFEAQQPEVKREIYNQLMKTEIEAGKTLFFSRFVDVNEDEYIEQLNKSFEDHQKEQVEREDFEEGDQKGPGFESNIEQRIRFRNEQRASMLLLNHDFDQAEDIIKAYIDDYNFKLILAVFEILDNKEGESETQNRNYSRFTVHHYDNHALEYFEGESIQEEVIAEVRVEDDVRFTETE